MASGTPIFRQVSWLAAIPSLMILAVAAAMGQLMGGQNGIYVALACCFGYAMVARSLVAREHRGGIRLVRRGRFSEAIPRFERSFAFFDRHRWLDDWRGLVLLSSSRASYREMAMLNSAFCYSQVGEGTRAAETYRRCLGLFPGSGMAEAALKMMESARPKA